MGFTRNRDIVALVQKKMYIIECTECVRRHTTARHGLLPPTTNHEQENHGRIKQIFGTAIPNSFLGQISYIRWVRELLAKLARLQCPPHQCVDDLGSHTCGWSAQGFLPYSKYDVNVLILYGRYQGPLATGHRLVGLRPATLSEK